MSDHIKSNKPSKLREAKTPAKKEKPTLWLGARKAMWELNGLHSRCRGHLAVGIVLLPRTS